MKFNRYLEQQKREEWADAFLDYKALKDRIKASAREAKATGETGVAYSPRAASLSVQRARNEGDIAEESFFELLEHEVAKVGAFTQQQVAQISTDITSLQQRADAAEPGEKAALTAEAKRIGGEFLALEKYVNLNYLGFHKAVKKHDKMLPHAPCQQFYIHVLRNQPWVQGDHSQLLVQLSSVYQRLRGPTRSSSSSEDEGLPGITSRAVAAAAADPHIDRGLGLPGRVTRRYWVRTADVSAVKHHILQHLPVSAAGQDQPDGTSAFLNSVYLDNASLELYHGLLDKRPGATTMRIRWFGAEPTETVALERQAHSSGNESEEDVLQLPERFVAPFLAGSLPEKEFVRNLRRIQEASGDMQDDGSLRRSAQLFGDLTRLVSAMQLAPILRTQAMRSAYGDSLEGGSFGVRLTLDTNVVMLKEDPYAAVVSDRWARDTSQQLPRTDMTRFPHAILDIQLDRLSLQSPPDWLQELYGSGYLTEVHAFSKMLHGVATLLPDALRAVPYWVDDESVRASMAASGPSPPHSIQGTVLPAQNFGGSVRRAAAPALSDLSHPLLGDAPTLQLMPDRTDIPGFGYSTDEEPTGCLAWWFLNRERERKLDSLDLPLLGANTAKRGPPPKNVFALERTYLAWMHMSLTVGAIAAALIGIAGGSAPSAEKGLTRMTDVVAMIMLLLAVAIAAYALVVYLRRETLIERNDEDTCVVDFMGPKVITGIITAALGAIFIISLVDFIMCL